MKKYLNKITCISLILFMLLDICSNVFAADVKTSLDVIQEASETKYLDNDQGNISKTIVDSNSETGEVTIELKLSNTKKEKEQKKIYENTEVYLLIDEGISRNDEKLSKYISNIEKLVSKIFKTNTKTKVGIIGIKGPIADSYVDESGKLVDGDKDEATVEGNASNSEIVIKPTNSIDTIKSGLQKMNSSKTRYYSNLQAAIKLANSTYSENTNKILISLYDGVPSVAIGVKSQVNTGWLSEYSTMEEAVKGKHEKISTYTRDEILKLKDSNISFILLRPDDTSYDERWYSSSTGEKVLDFDGSPYVKKLYGTIESPTYGKMYSFSDSTIDTIITENIYQDVKKLIQPDMCNVKLVDYFPKDITENFEFSYVGKPSTGAVSDKIDTKNNIIEWDIGILKGNEIATLRYKLKIKDLKNKKLLNKTIATNEKVILTYKDTAEKDYTVTLSSSPKIKLSEVKETETNTVGKNEIGTNTVGKNDKDSTTAKGILPKAGTIMTITFAIIGIALFSIIAYKKYSNYKDIK